MKFISILFLLCIALLAYAISVYNKLIKNKNLVDDGWSGIETQLKRRSNLIPNLVETVKGYATHEREALEAVTSLRNQTMSISDGGGGGW
jgi:LemA protein